MYGLVGMSGWEMRVHIPLLLYIPFIARRLTTAQQLEGVYYYYNIIILCKKTAQRYRINLNLHFFVFFQWSRAKLINKILNDQFKTDPIKIWRTKQILIFARLHGFHPVRIEAAPKPEEDSEWSSWNDLENSRKTESNIRKMYPNSKDITSLSLFKSDGYVKSDETLNISDDEELDVIGDKQVIVKHDTSDVNLKVLSVTNDDKLKFFYIEAKCAEIGVELRNEDVGEGYSYR